MSSTIVITYDDVTNGPTNISSSVMFAETTFESQMAAIPGTFRVVVKDPGHTHTFTTGRELTLDVDGHRLYGGYVLNVAKEYAFPADNTSTPSLTKSRRWVLTGVDYNILLEKRILWNHANNLKVCSTGTAAIYDGEVVRTWIPQWCDIPSGFDFTNASNIIDIHQYAKGFQQNPGTTLKAALDDMAQFGGVFYIDADKKLHFVPVQDTAASWGFSDKPSLSDSPPTIGFRDGEMTEDATAVVNDALVWGGTGDPTSTSTLANATIVFAHKTNSTSITNHGRWQYAENRIGQSNYKSSTEVTARANVIVDGNQSGSFIEGTKGLVNPEKQFTGTWFAHDAPGGVHLRPPQVVYINLQVFGFDMSVPLRQMQITFPGLDASGKAFVQFTGLFGVLMTDPYWLWSYLKGRQGQTVSGMFSGANNDSVNPAYGSQYQDSPTEAPDGSRTVFHIPFAYLGNTVIAYKNGLALVAGVAFTESDPANGEITYSSPPASTDVLYIVAILAG